MAGYRQLSIWLLCVPSMNEHGGGLSWKAKGRHQFRASSCSSKQDVGIKGLLICVLIVYRNSGLRLIIRTPIAVTKGEKAPGHDRFLLQWLYPVTTRHRPCPSCKCSLHVPRKKLHIWCPLSCYTHEANHHCTVGDEGSDAVNLITYS